MKKILYLLLVSLFVFTSCNQEEEIIDVTLKSKPDPVVICHYDKITGTWSIKNANSNSAKAHLNHGDVQLIDADGDGWVESENECVPGGDCDDTNPDINPGMEEICGNEIDDNCDGYVDENCRTYVPDDAFENALIYWGYDDIMDDYVLTSNIDTIESLYFGEAGFESPFTPWDNPLAYVGDLTGIEDFTSLKFLGINNHSFNGNALWNNIALERLVLLEAHVTNDLNLSNNTSLTTIYFFDIYIESLDLSNNTALTYLDCMMMDNMKFLNLKNGNNTAIPDLILEGTGPICVQVDDVAWSTANWTKVWGAYFSEDCSSTSTLALGLTNEPKHGSEYNKNDSIEEIRKLAKIKFLNIKEIIDFQNKHKKARGQNN